MINFFGYLGALCLAVCGVPQAVKAWRTGSAADLSWCFLGLWLGGEACMTLYVLGAIGCDAPLIMNYAINGAVTLYLLSVKSRGINFRKNYASRS